MKSHRIAALTITLGFFINGILSNDSDNEVEDECIWEDRSYTGDQPPSVLNAKAECNKGKLIWHHPYGGLRASFHPGAHIKGGFKLCFKCKNPEVTIFREGVNSMTLLKEGHDSKAKSHYCLHSSKKHIVLYIEATKLHQNKMTLDYTIKPLKKKFLHRNKACKPCRYDRLFHLICKSDFAITGYINSSVLIPKTHYKQIDFVGEKLLQQKHELFTKSDQNPGYYMGKLRFPVGCGGKGKHNQLLITGKGSVVTCFTQDKHLIRLVSKYYEHLCMKW
ncbi:meteorin-like protein [Exaiptasia diaphana]|uniref:Meteorin-like protein n=1 Tax=Exaiptasia diaphana TaxID=2652724 RepID=A0A913YIP6_EXADI|nr:meteorin-like protein [Exaiptasia diaphana]XP_028514893.1 meteorin-like protein [Exaiptasia diaphana]KXJ26791.1 Meteorin-like protein [Exaiptasia diaphana]